MPEVILPKPFQGSEHEPFLWTGRDRAALLIHGFPGSPAEMRPLGTAFREIGWTVQGVTLPGLGADFETLEKRGFLDWTNTVREAAIALKKNHSVVIFIGYSMGGALALHAAAEEPPAGLVLLAPFWTLGEGLARILWPVIRLLFRRVKPLKRANLSAIDVRHGLQRMFGSIDLDNPAIQQALREITVSLSPVDQIRQLGYSAYARAPALNVPTLVIQGSRDNVVPPFRTKRLIGRFARSVQYIEVQAGHDVVDPDSGAWTQVKDQLHLFAEKFQQRNPNQVS
jgi:carboxylesterase